MTKEELDAISREFGPARPKVVSILSMVALIVGAMWLPFGPLGLAQFALFWTTVASQVVERPGYSVPLVFLWFPLGASVVGGVAIRGACQSLNLSSRGRVLLVWTYYGAAALLSGFCLSIANEATSCRERAYFCQAPSAFQMNFALIAVILGIVLAIPCVYAARKLSSREVMVSMR